MNFNKGNICAIATPTGVGAIGVIRVSGPDAITITNKIFKGKNLEKQPSHTLHFGLITANNQVIDEVLVSVFKAPHSYTGENSTEISCHGSPYILKEVVKLLLKNGAQIAQPGEFTLRAFLNGKLDLSQAEAVADIIASQSEKGHQIAMNQMRGGFSKEISALRNELINFASLVELELDFSEEDVEFANRDDLKALILKIQLVLNKLIDSFSLGNVLKDGIAVVIAGKPNAGKSTLLNALLNEERALVTEIEGTTRDTIEDELVIEGIKFRFIDTAGLRTTSDKIEAMGVVKSFEKIRQAQMVLLLFDANETTTEELKIQANGIEKEISKNSQIVLIGNKIDQSKLDVLQQKFKDFKNVIFISAKQNWNVDALKKLLLQSVETGKISGNETIVSNTRHWQELTNANDALARALNGLETGITGDFVAMDIRAALHHLGLITGEITTDDLLGNIFGKFCIGK